MRCGRNRDQWGGGDGGEEKSSGKQCFQCEVGAKSDLLNKARSAVWGWAVPPCRLSCTGGTGDEQGEWTETATSTWLHPGCLVVGRQCPRWGVGQRSRADPGMSPAQELKMHPQKPPWGSCNQPLKDAAAGDLHLNTLHRYTVWAKASFSERR